MKKPLLERVAFIGNSLPRRCGIATFTTDLQRAVAASYVNVRTTIVAMTDHGQTYEYPPAVCLSINDDAMIEYAAAAEFLNAGDFDVVCLQHEFGIFGGDTGSHILELLSRLRIPVVTTLHTVLGNPSDSQLRVLKAIVALSERVIVMADRGRHLLENVYEVPAAKVVVIPHGTPDTAFVEPDQAKEKLGFANRTTILTFGLLSPSKGIEVMIDAMPAILARSPDALYVVLGATHPNLVRREGEAYRESLVARAATLGIQEHIVFLDQFVDQTTLLDFIAMSDVYVTPYLNEAQMTSGTLAYSFGLGKAVVSTPYVHARELLDDGRGLLVPFGDSKATGEAIISLLTDGDGRQRMRERAYAFGRAMTWERTASRYMETFEAVNTQRRTPTAPSAGGKRETHTVPVLPRVHLGHFRKMCDDTGLFQHAVYSIPDRTRGYCVDDNARALILSCAPEVPGGETLSDGMKATFAAFVHHAWNPLTKRFRNFMSFERTWLEEAGSEDSHGRTVWALGVCARADVSDSRRRWAAALFSEVMPTVEQLRSPRAWAFCLLGLEEYALTAPGDRQALALRRLLGQRLVELLTAVERPGWLWFEESLAYDNARLPQALIQTGVALGIPSFVDAGLRSLRWLMGVQTAKADVFRPVGSASFGEIRRLPRPFDQQPLEATAAIAACAAAWSATGDYRWRADAGRAFAWFLGNNDLSAVLVDPVSGGCRDGLHPDRVNENMGGESVVSYLLALADMGRLAADVAERHERQAQALALSA